ncbi:MAG: hypothetical protein KTR14_08910 [Vampirovibrio sp.]|nr:hypothetical protein [Vampirovibrio sp.]
MKNFYFHIQNKLPLHWMVGMFLTIILTAVVTNVHAAESHAWEVQMDANASGAYSHQALSAGDTVMLTLINPTSSLLTFQTTEQLGAASRYTVPPHMSRTVSFSLEKPLTEDVEYIVLDTQGQTIFEQTMGLSFHGAPCQQAG